jgi:transcriptional regulator of acetoin/glycerol metabolism
VHHGDHFRTRHIGLSCTGVPIHDPDGTLIAVLDASSVDARDTRKSQMHTMALVHLSGRLIEKCLFLRRQESGMVLRFHSRPELVNLLHDGALALSDAGAVLAADDTAVRLLGATDRSELTGRPLHDIFDVKAEELGMTFGARRPIWPVRDIRNGQRFFVSLHDGRPTPSKIIRPLLGVPGPARADKHVSRSGLSLQDLAGEDPQMLRNVNIAQRIANSTISVLIQGPTGSGKEVFARALHFSSQRADRLFVAVNCAAIPASLIESELFGYRPGAFTGAGKSGMRGKVLQACGGTLFLDEIGDMPLDLQTRLLRVLEEQEVTPLGSETPLRVDLRVMCATHRDLRELISRGDFREDLYFRLGGITLELPALAQRADLRRLIDAFLMEEQSNVGAIGIDPDALRCLLQY